MEKELEAQIEKFRLLTGFIPAHVDGHQHVHIARVVFPVFCRVLSKYGIRITRIPIEQGLEKVSWLPEKRKLFYTMLTEESRRGVETGLLKNYGISALPFVGYSVMGKDLTVKNVRQALSCE